MRFRLLALTMTAAIVASVFGTWMTFDTHRGASAAMDISGRVNWSGPSGGITYEYDPAQYTVGQSCLQANAAGNAVTSQQVIRVAVLGPAGEILTLTQATDPILTSITEGSFNCSYAFNISLDESLAAWQFIVTPAFELDPMLIPLVVTPAEVAAEIAEQDSLVLSVSQLSSSQ